MPIPLTSGFGLIFLHQGSVANHVGEHDGRKLPGAPFIHTGCVFLPSSLRTEQPKDIRYADESSPPSKTLLTR
jgi:hypothetical protein